MELPLIVFSGTLMEGESAWKATRNQVMQALEAHSCFEAEYADVGEDLREAVFGVLAEELFSLPPETKMKNIGDKPNNGYMGQIQGFPYESFAIHGADRLDQVRRFVDLMWPYGGPKSDFCKTIWEFTKKISDLEKIIRLMILEGLGVEKTEIETLTRSTEYGLRLSLYGTTEEEELLHAHTDPNMFSIVIQHKVPGLEIQSNDGRWIRISQTPFSFTFLVGDAFQAWTNGRIRSTRHRVAAMGNDRRYSAIVGSQPDDRFMVEAPREVSGEGEDHLRRRRRYAPYLYSDYLRFRFSPEGVAAENVLAAFQEASCDDGP